LERKGIPIEKRRLRADIIVTLIFAAIVVLILIFSFGKMGAKMFGPRTISHTSFDYLKVKKPAIESGFLLKDGETPECFKCHVEVNFSRFKKSVHGKLKCEACHPGMGAEFPKPMEAETGWQRRASFLTCLDCHKTNPDDYKNDPHVEAVQKGDKRAPLCGRCHGNHYIQKATSDGSVVSRLNQPALCGKCHEKEEETYDMNFHGRALVGHSYLRSASCSDCHGPHRVGLNDFKKSEDKVSACRRCHLKANKNFVQFVIHQEEFDKRYPILNIVTLFMIILTISVLTLFYAHTVLWFIRNVTEKVRTWRGR